MKRRMDTSRGCAAMTRLGVSAVVSFNPFKHIDPFGTILLPALLLLMRSPFLFGYAKPVPVNFRALRQPRRDMIWVAAAGPAMNFALATAAALSFHLIV
jgi:Zn-dependent protease